jgi:transcription initiation factor TFIIIB Brf1 subunit/transcription initiation factor TFIIB
MKSAETLLKNGNKRNVGRKGKNKPNITRDFLGEENITTLCKMHLDMALNDPDKEVRRKCMEFLLDKVLTKAAPIPYRNYVDIDLLPMTSPENIKINENIILENLSNGKLTLDETKDLMNITVQGRNTWEATVMATKLEELDQHVKSLKK